MRIKIKTIVFGLISIFLIFTFLVLLINTPIFDAKLNPKITKVLNQRSLPKTEGNAYYAIMGIKASSDKNIVATGFQLIKRYQANRAVKKDELTQEDYNEILNVKEDIDQQWLDKFGKCQSKSGEDCLGKLAKILSTSQNKSSRLLLMQQRYDKIINMNKYANFNDITMGTPFPDYIYLLRLGNLKKAELYMLPEKYGFLLQVSKELKFFKMQLVHGEMILDQMVAQANIRNNIQHLSNYLRNYNVPENELAIIDSLLTPLTKDELDISRGYISESRTLFKAIDDAEFFDLDYILFQSNDYHNLFYKYFTEPYVKMSKMSSIEIVEAVKDGYIDSILEEKNSLLGYSPSSLYNFSGKAMLSGGFCDNCWDYAARVHDLNNIISLVKLQLELKTNNQSNIKQAILNSKVTDNYTKNAFEYEAKDNSIYFKCLDERYSKCSIKL